MGKRVLGIDPGKVNFGWAIYGDEGLERHGVLDGAEELSDLPGWRQRFLDLIRRWKPDAVCIERFSRRFGKGGQKESEIMNIMIGQASGACLVRGMACHLVTASAHKGWLSRNFEVQLYPVKPSKAKKVVTKKWDIGTYIEWQVLAADYTYHEVDAANLAKYGYDTIFNDTD